MATKKAATTRSTATPAPRPCEGAPRESRSRRPTSGSGDRSRPEIRAAAAAGGARTPMRVDATFAAGESLREKLRRRVIGQDAAVDALTGAWARLLSGLRDPQRPLLTALLLGPTGVGKTETALALAEALFGTPRALTRINCEEYSQGHEVARLLGSPPGYVGADIEPLLSQERIDRPHAELRAARARRARTPVGAAGAPDREPTAAAEGDETPAPVEVDALIDQVHGADEGLHSILLFDEIEKAHPTLWNTLLGVLEEGQITLGNNRTTDLTRSIILITSNAGSREMGAALERRALGFAARPPLPDGGALREIAEQAARGLFPVEFLNRFDEVLVYAPLGDEALTAIFDRLLDDIVERALDRAEVPLLVRVSATARRHVVAAGTDPTLGARPLRRAMERLLVDPLSRLLAAGELVQGDVVDVELEDDGLSFYRLPRQGDAVVA